MLMSTASFWGLDEPALAALRKCVRYDMMTRDQREKLRESEDTLDLYMQALGFLD